MQATGITAVIVVPDLPNTPARVNRETGVMEISARQTQNMPPEYVLFIMMHEAAHVMLQTVDEEKADAWAFQQLATRGYSLKGLVRALTRVLNGADPEHRKRMNLQLERAIRFDREHNGNHKI